MSMGAALWMQGVIVGCCCPPATLDDSQGPLTASDVAYDTLRDNYNSRTKQIDQIYSKARIRFEWIDRDKKKHVQEGGDSTLIVRKPHDLALAISHELTETLFWLGSNRDQFWILELKPPKGEPRRATVGKHGALRRNPASRLPIPIEPSELMMLVGIVDLPSKNLTADQAVYKRNGSLVVDLPLGRAAKAGDPFLRVEIDATKYRPKRFAIHDPKRPAQPLMHAVVRRYQKLLQHQVVKVDWPSIPTDILIVVPHRQTRITMTLNHFNDGRPNRIDDDQFDFRGLLESFGVDPKHVERLDAPQANGGKSRRNRVSSQGS
jgi:hypothetical protein